MLGLGATENPGGFLGVPAGVWGTLTFPVEVACTAIDPKSEGVCKTSGALNLRTMDYIYFGVVGFLVYTMLFKGKG